jgi:UDP-N-acetylmuramoyl-tripeptide--D-alanyl-D-alanine ligase
MRDFSLSEIRQPLRAQVHGADVSFRAVSTDTRSIGKGDLFVALNGENFDGHNYIASACERGACAALVSRQGEYPVATLQVADTRLALGQLGALNREYFEGELLAITGSSGKTSVKNMLASILGQVAPTLATPGNFNNEIGLPLTLLQLQPEHRFAVIEMGAARRGDIDYLCKLAQPRVALLLNAMEAHLEGFGSVEEVARAKGEILEAVSDKGANGVAVINADSPYVGLWRELAGSARRLEFGLQSPAAVTARDLDERGLKGSQFILDTPAGEVPVRLKMPGHHNVMNALAAATAALALDISLLDISRGLAEVKAEPGRLERHRLQAGVQLIDDSYNANPGSVSAAIDLLAATSGHKVLVLGSMAELGEGSESLHRQVGEYAREQGIDECWLLGRETQATARGFGSAARYCDSRQELVEQLETSVPEGSTILVKGSRSAAMDKVVQALLNRARG